MEKGGRKSLIELALPGHTYTYKRMRTGKIDKGEICIGVCQTE